MRFLLLLAITGCSTQQRVSLGPTVGARSGKIGAEITAEAVAGEGIGLVASASGRLAHEVSGGGFRFGVEAARNPLPWGGRFTATLGPTWIGSDDGGATLDARISVAGYRGYRKKEPAADGSDWAAPEDRHTLGVELFASSIGTDTEQHEVLIGIGVTFGSWSESSGGGWASVSPPDRER
jgi:hypothetical protein